ncbi:MULTISPECIES: hypothetical protein [Paenibacillus]|nr:hypothetical protein [Paenibacillus alvei]MEC0079610.1 hypothetical protein [Paenibacillus alvei]
MEIVQARRAVKLEANRILSVLTTASLYMPHDNQDQPVGCLFL